MKFIVCSNIEDFFLILGGGGAAAVTVLGSIGVLRRSKNKEEQELYGLPKEYYDDVCSVPLCYYLFFAFLFLGFAWFSCFLLLLVVLLDAANWVFFFNI